MKIALDLRPLAPPSFLLAHPRMLIKKAKVPAAFLEALSQPSPSKQPSTRLPSQVELLRSKLSAHYRSNDTSSGSTTEQQDNDDHYWEQSGQVIRWVGEHVSRIEVYRNRTTARPNEKLHRQLVASRVNRMLKHEPLSYVLGSQPFGPLEIICQKPVLIPRPETEHIFEHLSQILVKTAAQHHQGIDAAPLKVLDLCTGTGCIALLLRHRLNEAEIKADITAVDKSRAAVSLALLNEEACSRALHDTSMQTTTKERGVGGSRRIDRLGPAIVTIERADIFDDDAVDRLIHRNGPFDVIASNPPYVTGEEWKTLDKNVRDWEDPDALIGDTDDSQDGLAFYRRIALLIEKMGILRSSPTSSRMPSLLVEVGHKQAKAVQALFVATGRFSKMELIEDQWQQQRGVMGWTQFPDDDGM